MWISRIQGSIKDGGWRCSGEILNSTLATNQEITVYSDLLTTNGLNSDHIAFNGYVLPDPLNIRFQYDSMKFAAYTAQEYMKRNRAQGVYFTDQASPQNWHQITDMTYAKIVDHIIGKTGEYGHCNLTKEAWPNDGILIKNIDDSNSSSLNMYDLKEGSFWTRLKSMADVDQYIIYMTKDNVFTYKPHTMFSPPSGFTLNLDENNILDNIIVRELKQETGQVIISGTTPNGMQLSAKYPTDHNGGETFRKSGYVATDVSMLADVAARLYRLRNREYSIQLGVNGPIGLYCELMDRVSLTFRNFVSSPFYIESISAELRPELCRYLSYWY